jgi:hypothetical protein
VQECLICEALFLKELLFDVRGCIVVVVVLVLIIVGFLFSLAFLVVLGCVFNSFVLCKVHKEVCRRLCVREVTCGKELRAGSLAFFVRIVS